MKNYKLIMFPMRGGDPVEWSGDAVNVMDAIIMARTELFPQGFFKAKVVGAE